MRECMQLTIMLYNKYGNSSMEPGATKPQRNCFQICGQMEVR